MLSVLSILMLVGVAEAKQSEPEQVPEAIYAVPKVHRLENGITLIIQHRTDPRWPDDLVILSAYSAGVLNEPGTCPGVAFPIAGGMINPNSRRIGSTEPDFPGVPAVVSLQPHTTLFLVQGRPRDLPELLQVEADRLNARNPRLSEEGDLFTGPFWQVEAPSGIGPLAVCNHTWRTGKERLRFKRLPSADMPADAVERFRRDVFAPSSLTLTIIGAVDEAAVLRLAEQQLGVIPKSRAEGIDLPDMAHVPDSIHVQVPGDLAPQLIMAFPYAEGGWDRLVMTLWGAVLQERVDASATLTRLAEEVFVSGAYLPHKGVPFILGARMRVGADMAQLRRALDDWLAEAVTDEQVRRDLPRINERYHEILSNQKPENGEAEIGRVMGLLVFHTLGMDLQQTRESRKDVSLADLTRVIGKAIDVRKRKIVVLENEPKGE